jgi:uncharacterized protein (UPF0548 family)
MVSATRPSATGEFASASNDARAPEWRLGRGWSAPEILERLRALPGRPSTAPHPEEGEGREATSTRWRHYFSEARIARETPGPPAPDGAFERARELVERYVFSDPRIVLAHFDTEGPLLGRHMLLELKVLGIHYLCGVVVGAVHNSASVGASVFEFRYDTLLGHLEAGSEWFSLSKDHDTGSVDFRIRATWRPGQFPNWWSRLGFEWLARRYQRAWHRLAYVRLRAALGEDDLAPLPRRRELLREGRPLPKPSITSVASPIPPSGLVVEVQE